MKKILIFLSLGFFIIAMPLSAQAQLFTFSGADEGGIGSATMLFNGLNSNNWMVTINNTSPTNLEDGTLNANASGIDGFGFDVNGDYNLISWELNAFDINNDPVTLGSSAIAGDWDIAQPGGSGSISVDLFFSNGTGVQESLYNPAAIGTGAPIAADPFFTTATLVMVFEVPEDLMASFQSSPPDGSPFVRMQNVGENGEGSLKLIGSEEPVDPVPEPATMLLLGSGLVGLAGFGRKKFLNKKN